MQEITWHPTYTQPLRSQLQTTLELWHSEVTRILPSFPGTLKIEFDNDFLIPGYNVGGAAWDEQYLKLAYDPTESTDREAQFAELRAIYFHEGYHLARGVSFVTTPDDLPALTNAIEEGLATKFEVVYTGSTPGYAKYEDRGTMLDWLEEVRRLPDGFDYDWQRWKFFDSETKRQWILYKVGMFMVDEALHNKPDLKVEHMIGMSIGQIITLTKL